MSAPTAIVRRVPPATIALWALQVVVALAFIAAGSAKLFAAPPMVELFDKIGLGQWFRILTGVIEVAGGVLLLWRGRSGYGAVLLSTTMIAALFAHLTLIGGAWQPAAVLLAPSALLVWLNRHQLRIGR